MGGEVPLKVLLASHWINKEISPIYTSAFVAYRNRTNRILQQWRTFSLLELVLFFFTFCFFLVYELNKHSFRAEKLSSRLR